MKTILIGTRKGVVGHSPAPQPGNGIQPQEYRMPMTSHMLIAPHHAAHRPLHTLQIPNHDMGWMSPVYQSVIKPFTGTVSSPPAVMKAGDVLPFSLKINGVSYA
jgi:hypothetical protein